jgi:hypothetical protein
MDAGTHAGVEPAVSIEVAHCDLTRRGSDASKPVERKFREEVSS